MRARTRRFGSVLSLTAAALAAAVVPAFAHASFDVSKAPADTEVDLVIFAPLERDDTNSRIEALFPTGFDVDGCGGPAAWLCDIEPGSNGTVVTRRTLTPTENDIAFEVAIRTPATPDAYAIPVVQTYSDGTEAAWIGPAGSAEPAPILTVTGGDDEVEQNTTPPAAHDDGGDEPTPTRTASPTPAAAPAPSTTSEPTPADEPAEVDAEDAADAPATEASPDPSVAAESGTGNAAVDTDETSQEPRDAGAAADGVGSDDATELALTPAGDDEGGPGALGFLALGLLLTAGGSAAWWWRTQQD